MPRITPISDEWLQAVKDRQPELRTEKLARYKKEFDIPDYDAEILTGSAEGVVLVPYEAVNTDKEGDFCYLVKDGVIVRQNVVTGISSDMDVEIKEGVSEGDTVVISSDMDLMEGLQVNPVMQ